MPRRSDDPNPGPGMRLQRRTARFPQSAPHRSTNSLAASCSMSPVAGVPAQGTTHVFTVRPGRPFDDTRTYRTRRPHTKSKLGCSACKTKRVKCDEEKPQCRRCKRSNSTCLYEDGGVPGTAGSAATGTANLHRLPGTLSKTPIEQRLIKHYDDVTSQAVDTITFSNFLYGDRSPQYRATILDQAKDHPLLMHSMLAVSALHFNHFGNTDYRESGISHLNTALSELGQSVTKPIPPEDSPRILYSAMLITLYYTCIDSTKVEHSWVFSKKPQRLAWLTVQQGLVPLFGQTRKYHEDTFMAPVFKHVEEDDAVDHSIPRGLWELCGCTTNTREAELRGNPYIRPLHHLTKLMPLDRTLPNAMKFLAFTASLDKAFFNLLSINDERALLITSYGFALMCNIELWWTQPRARRDCWAICSHLDQVASPSVRAHLGFPARACGYWSHGLSVVEEPLIVTGGATPIMQQMVPVRNRL